MQRKQNLSIAAEALKGRWGLPESFHCDQMKSPTTLKKRPWRSSFEVKVMQDETKRYFSMECFDRDL